MKKDSNLLVNIVAGIAGLIVSFILFKILTIYF